MDTFQIYYKMWCNIISLHTSFPGLLFADGSVLNGDVDSFHRTGVSEILLHSIVTLDDILLLLHEVPNICENNSWWIIIHGANQ